jgi:hypothetical protein
MDSQRRAAVVAVMAAVSATVSGTPASATVPGNNGWLAFDSRRDGAGSDLYRITPAGAQEARLAASVPGANDARPTWSPPGPLRVGSDVFLEENQLHIPGSGFLNPPVDDTVTVGGKPAKILERPSDIELIVALPDGTDATSFICVTQQANLILAPGMVFRVHASEGAGASWDDCDSQPLAFQSDRSGDYDIWIYDPASALGPGNPVNVTRFPGAHDTAPVWSDFGLAARPQSLIAFVSDRYGSRDIFVLDPWRPLSDDPALPNPARVTTSPGDDANPEWSPDGDRLVFESDRAGPKDLWTVAVPPAGVSAPEYQLQQMTADVEESFDPTWATLGSDTSADGFRNAVVFAGPESEGGDCELNQIDGPDRSTAPNTDSPMTTAADPNYKDDSPAYGPVGDPVAFASIRGGNEDIYLLSSDPALSRVTTSPGPDRHPAWQPDYLGAQLHYYRPLGRPTNRRKRPRTSQVAGDRHPCAEPPSARFRFEPERPAPGQEVRFDAGASSDGEGAVERFEWDFDGDGLFEASGTGATARHTYSDRGVHDVVLRILDEDGDSQRVRRAVPVGVEPPPECTHLGTPGDDVMAGTPGRDVMCGLGGNDVLYGQGADDVLDGGSGNDRLFGGAGGDRLEGAGGRDRLHGGSGADRLRDGPGADRLLAGAGNDRLAAGAGRDRLSGDSGNDRLSGGTAGGRLSGGRGRDRVTGGPGSDSLSAGPGRDVLLARDGRRDLVAGGRHRDRARVDRRTDRLRGVEVVLE